MAALPYLPLWTDAYLADTRHLSAIQHGMNVLLLISAWRDPDCSLPNDPAMLATLASVNKKDWVKLSPTVLQLWTLHDDGRWRQKRLTHEREKVTELVEQRRAAGRVSAAKKKERSSTSVQRESSTHTHNHTNTHTHSFRSPEQRDQSPLFSPTEHGNLPEHLDEASISNEWLRTALKVGLTEEQAALEFESFKIHRRDKQNGSMLLKQSDCLNWLTNSPFATL